MTLALDTVYSMDCLDGMRELPDASVDLFVTSPPYDALRDYRGGWSLNLHNVGVEVRRLLKPGGVCVMAIQDQTREGRKSLTSFRTIVDWVDSIGLSLWECCIYYRRGTPGAWWEKRFRVDHEYIPIFLKGSRPQYFSKDHMLIDNPSAGKHCTGTSRATNGSLRKIDTVCASRMCPGTVLHYASSSRERVADWEIKKQHPATFPDKLASDFIQAFTLPGMLVCDPFAGSGTVLKMAKALGRHFIGFEISPEYCEIARRRLSV